MGILQGKFVWFEHLSADADAAARFYGALFGWDVQSVAMGGGEPYRMLHNAGQGIGGLRGMPAGTPAAWMSYLSVDSVDASVAAAQAAGAAVLMPPTDFPPVGRGATLADPTGAAFSVWTSADGDAPDADVPLGGWYWNELWSADAARALAFYSSVFGYTHEAMDMGPQGTYYVLNRGGKPRAGLMQSVNPQARSMWLPYVHVARCDDALAQAARLGGQVLMPATDIPNIGRFAIAADPTGAAFAFINQPA